MESADFKEGVILPDGGYLPMKEGHLHTLMNVTGIPEAKLWEMIPKDDSPLFWLIAYHGFEFLRGNENDGGTEGNL